MKKIFSILIAMTLCFIMSSCVTEVQAQVDDVYYNDDIDINLVITYGTPFYNAEGLIIYYVYRDMYYYPYYYHNRYYFHRYRSPLPRHRMGIYKPVPRDFYRHHHHHRHFTPRNGGGHTRPDVRPRPNPGTPHSTPNIQPRRTVSPGSVVRGSHSAPRVNSRPNTAPMRPSSPSHTGGRFGGRR